MGTRIAASWLDTYGNPIKIGHRFTLNRKDEDSVFTALEIRDNGVVAVVQDGEWCTDVNILDEFRANDLIRVEQRGLYVGAMVQVLGYHTSRFDVVNKPLNGYLVNDKPFTVSDIYYSYSVYIPTLNAHVNAVIR